MLKFNRKTVTWATVIVFVVTLTTILSKGYYEAHAEKVKLEEEKSKLDKQVTDLEGEKESVEQKLDEKDKEVRDTKKKIKKEKEKTEKEKKAKEKLEEDIKKKNDRIKKLEKDLQAKRDREKNEAEKVVAVSNSGGSSNTTKSGNGKTMTMNTSYYGMDCAGCTGRTASGYKLSSGQTTVNGYKVVAADTSILPLHSKIKVTNPDGSSYNAVVLDRGGAIKGQKLDVLVGSEAESSRHGRHNTTVEVLSYGNNSYQKVN